MIFKKYFSNLFNDLYRKEFINFLKENGVFESYCSNFRKDKNNLNSNAPKRFFSTHNYIAFLFSAFNWEKTKKGYLFWNSLNTIWTYKKLDEGKIQKVKSLISYIIKKIC